ncbi:MAG: hypothetical protein CMJ32_00850 [Phycisphaerae bacterium]|nr:hypothetical protein [Phycisphaerae bacterium]
MVGVMLGWMDNTEATDRMRVSGIADAYTGLRQMVDSARPASSEALFRVSPEFPEFQEPGDMVETMLQVDDSLSRLQGLAGTGWVVPESDPDISGISEAGRITDLLRLLEDTKDPSLQDQRFLQMLRACGSVANRLELMLETGTQDAGSLDRQLGILEDSCTKCHDRYRNN